MTHTTEEFVRRELRSILRGDTYRNRFVCLPCLVSMALERLHPGWRKSEITRAVDRIGGWGLWLIVLFLIAAYLGAAFGPPPPNVEAIAWAGLTGGALTAALGYWVDAHRTMAA